MPWDGAGVLRMLQLLELAHLRVRPHPSRSRPWVPEKFLLFTHIVSNNLAITMGVRPLLAGTSLI